MEMWQILVPSEKPDWMPGKKRYFSTKYHRQWDSKVLAIAKGLTILQPAKGQWVSLTGELFKEKMIPVCIGCTREQIVQIIEMTGKHYQQLAIYCSKVSDEVIVQHFKEFADRKKEFEHTRSKAT